MTTVTVRIPLSSAQLRSWLAISCALAHMLQPDHDQVEMGTLVMAKIHGWHAFRKGWQRICMAWGSLIRS